MFCVGIIMLDTLFANWPKNGKFINYYVIHALRQYRTSDYVDPVPFPRMNRKISRSTHKKLVFYPYHLFSEKGKLVYPHLKVSM